MDIAALVDLIIGVLLAYYGARFLHLTGGNAAA